MTPIQSGKSLWAPGDTPEERVRWTSEVVSAIPNEGDFDDRNKWVGIAYALRAACGPDARCPCDP